MEILALEFRTYLRNLLKEQSMTFEEQCLAEEIWQNFNRIFNTQKSEVSTEE